MAWRTSVFWFSNFQSPITGVLGSGRSRSRPPEVANLPFSPAGFK